jgi:F-type H+-transporting ATPase subunit delta
MAELIAKRYGNALYELALETNKVDEIKTQLLSVKDILTNEKEFFDILSHPKIVVEEKIKIIEEAFNGKVNDEILGLMVLTIKKGRQKELTNIISYCIERIDEYNGILKAYITSPDALKASQKADIKARLETVTGKKVETNYSVDNSLIGGLIIRIGDRIVDNSIKGKMAVLSKQMYSL